MKQRFEKRPAESTTALAGAIVVILTALGVEVDGAAVAALVAGIAAIPSIVSALVDRYRSF